MNTFLMIGCLLLGKLYAVETSKPLPVNSLEVTALIPEKASQVSIIYPKNNQKVRGEYKIYGKASPGATVKLTISSKYFKTAHDNQDRISKGEGPINRMNRKFTLTADRSGNWILKNIELRNAGWEESFTIKVTSEERSVTINVYDKVHPVRMD
jgi:ribosomal protein L31